MSHHTVRRGVLLCLLLFAAGCGGGTRDVSPANVANPDRFLYDRGQAALKERKWLDAREYFRQVVDNYPGSPLRPDAKLAIGDTYLGEKSAESLVMADNEYREFLTFYPTNPRADYAQFKLAMSYFEQMRAPDRDQTATKEALQEFQVFFTRYPQSPLVPEARQKWREARDRLSDASFEVAKLYYRMRVDAGSASRLQEILKEDPEYTRRDGVYFYLAELYLRADNKGQVKPENKAQAVPYLKRLVTEFVESEYLEDARKRLQELNVQ
jgi:outer membrane protein assembly factor BamD